MYNAQLNACIGELGNISSLPIMMMNVVFETTPFWALGVYGRVRKAPIPEYTAVYSEVYGRILGVYGRKWGVSREGVRTNPPVLASFLHVYPSHTTLCN